MKTTLAVTALLTIHAIGGGQQRPVVADAPWLQNASPIVLTRGERTEIVVHNRADDPLGVHWHGLELESRGGALKPEPIELRAGVTYRLRFMHTSPDDRKRVRLVAGDQPVMWRALAKGGADVPPTLSVPGPADFWIDAGETYDFTWTPERAGDATLRITTTFQANPPGFSRATPPPHEMDIAVRIR